MILTQHHWNKAFHKEITMKSQKGRERQKAHPCHILWLERHDWFTRLPPRGRKGRYILGETFDKRLRLLEFAQSHRLTAANSLHPHKESRTTTWHQGADNGNDHNFILEHLKLNVKVSPQIYLDLEKLQFSSAARNFKHQIIYLPRAGGTVM